MPDNIREDLAISYCTREGVEFVRWEQSDLGFGMVGLTTGQPTMHHYLNWIRNFTVHGYYAPLLDLQEKVDE